MKNQSKSQLNDHDKAGYAIIIFSIIAIVLLVTMCTGCKKKNPTPVIEDPAPIVTPAPVYTGTLQITCKQVCAQFDGILSYPIVKIYSSRTDLTNNNILVTKTGNYDGILTTTLNVQPKYYYTSITGKIIVGNCQGTIKTVIDSFTISKDKLTPYTSYLR